MKKIINLATMAAFLLCGFLTTSCDEVDNPAQPEKAPATPAQLKKGIWTEYDGLLEASGKYTPEQLAAMPTLGMQIDGNKASFFLYTAEEASDPVEGQINYDSSLGKGTITFPTIKDNLLSGQSVDFSMTSDETMEFEFTYEGQKATASCAWLCESTDDWGVEVTNDEWKALMAYYEGLDASWGPDPTIDWGDFDEPLTWDEAPKANTRIVTAVLEGISTGLDIFSSLFEPDPTEEINAKLDALLEKVDQVLANQQAMMSKLGEMNTRLIAIAQKLNQQETVNIFNNRNEKFYNKFKTLDYYFTESFKLYNDNKADLSKVSNELKDFAKEWAGSGEANIDLTWQYIEYITTVQHTKYGVGMDKIYDGITYDKYPWEHMGIGDRKNYRAYDLTMIAKCIFMISLYSTYCDISNAKKGLLYNNYKSYKEKLLAFSKFNITNPDKYRVCQIPGAHFVMHKELQKYYYCDKNNEAPSSYFKDDAYAPRWHEAGNVKIENPKEMKSKLITQDEVKAMYEYYESIYPNEKNFWWMKILTDGNKSAGAVYPTGKAPSGVQDNQPCLLLRTKNLDNMGALELGIGSGMQLHPVWQTYKEAASVMMGYPPSQYIGSTRSKWQLSGSSINHYRSEVEYYAAIVEKRFDK